MGDKLQHRVMAILFVIILYLFAICSDYKLLDYYINDIPYNEYWNPSLGRKNETDYAVVFWGKRFFVDINGAVRNIFGQREMNMVCKLNNGQLTALYDTPIEEDILDAEALNIQSLYSYCVEIGVPFIFVAAPDKISPYDDELPLGKVDYSNSNTDIFLRGLERYGVPYIDLREELFRDGINQYDYFSKTDHHWNAYGGYWGYSKIRNWLDENEISYDTIPAEKENYTVQVYPGKLLGSLGQRVGKYFGGTDDFYVFEPKFETSVTVGDGTVSGSYENVLLNKSLLTTTTPEFIYDGVYLNTQNVLNNVAQNDTSILMISDSFSRVVNPYLILSVRNFSWATSYYTIAITKDFLKSGNFDAIILLQSPGNNLGSDLSFSFLTE